MVSTASTAKTWARARVVQGDPRGEVWEVTGEVREARIQLGADPRATWPIRAPRVQPFHVDLYWDGAVLWIADSANAGDVTLDGARVDDWKAVEGNGRLQFGGAVVAIETSLGSSDVAGAPFSEDDLEADATRVMQSPPMLDFPPSRIPQSLSEETVITGDEDGPGDPMETRLTAEPDRAIAPPASSRKGVVMAAAEEARRASSAFDPVSAETSPRTFAPSPAPAIDPGSAATNPRTFAAPPAPTSPVFAPPPQTAPAPGGKFAAPPAPASSAAVSKSPSAGDLAQKAQDALKTVSPWVWVGSGAVLIGVIVILALPKEGPPPTDREPVPERAHSTEEPPEAPREDPAPVQPSGPKVSAPVTLPPPTSVDGGAPMQAQGMATDGQVPGPTEEQIAADAYIAGNLDQALLHYESLARTKPNPVYTVIVDIIRRRIAQRCTNGVDSRGAPCAR